MPQFQNPKARHYALLAAILALACIFLFGAKS